MKRRAFTSLLAAGFGSLLLPQWAFAQVIDINDAINKAGRQRMLCQRMAKSYIALGLKMQSDSAEKILAASIALFELQLTELKSFAPTTEIKEIYGQLESTWGNYKTVLSATTPDKAGAAQVMQFQEKVLQLAHQGTVQLEGVSGKPVARLVNLAGRQRMLSQRMAAFYLSASWGIQPPGSAAEMAKALGEFAKAHEILKNAPEATPAIKTDLVVVESQFVFYETALGKLQFGVGDIQAQTNVFTTSERILQVMDGVTRMYSKLV